MGGGKTEEEGDAHHAGLEGEEGGTGNLRNPVASHITRLC